jgi:hypothetical protein
MFFFLFNFTYIFFSKNNNKKLIILKFELNTNKNLKSNKKRKCLILFGILSPPQT